MQKDKKAWFSQSVSRHICDLWVTEGGIITNWNSADFLFSNDASHPDTQRIFESLDFVENKATVFHASYLTACAEPGLRESVAIGHFLLPPSCLHEEIKAAIGSFIWEQENTFHPQQPQAGGDISKEKPYDMCRAEKERTKPSKLDICNSGDRNKNLGMETPSFEAEPCHIQQMYPVNNMVTESVVRSRFGVVLYKGCHSKLPFLVEILGCHPINEFIQWLIRAWYPPVSQCR
ncbi:telomere repeats-binding bouquet formation protein 2 isoform X2 [Narcine bancroftii]|uniref:telomere repeats-binding bouquet formation protein 2 isoform X2 n=1 Tax=Narcine bancroftii TaxID=1343680 RepID=UPI003831A3E2